jgi:C-terminal processing protease CtpA/Prc
MSEAALKSCISLLHLKNPIRDLRLLIQAGATMANMPMSDGGSLQDFVAAADDTVKGTLTGGRGLRDFLQTIDKLQPLEINLLVEQAIKLLEGFYVHLPLKRAMHGVDPLQRLRLLQRRLPQLTSEIAFHHEMTEIFTSVRDLHTNYILPSHFSAMTAFLPFRIEACFDNGQRKYIVANTIQGFSHASFVPGVELTYWNGVPIDRAVEIAASYHAGSNPAARHARGVAGLTKRAMNMAPPPDEEWVVIGYKDLAGNPLEFRADWTIMGLPPEADAVSPDAATEVAAAFGLDLEGDTFRRINKVLFAQHVIRAKVQLEGVRQTARMARMTARAGADESVEGADAAESVAVSAAVQGTDSVMPDVFAAKVVTAGARSFAYVRIYTFNVGSDVLFVNEFLRLIELPGMPKDGLIIDVRGNGGGLIWAGERLLQLLTPRTIEPCRLQFINTALNAKLCQKVAGLKDWEPSVSRAVETGATFSAGFPITAPERCNDIGQRYYGPILLITDARCYSTTDIFAAGFQDHEIGPILGTDDNTGAGGANVWTLEQIRNFFAANGVAPPPLESLPKGSAMRVAIRRTLRVGKEAGTELEDLGVQPSDQHQLTPDDILHDNPDLIKSAAKLLEGLGGRKFDVTGARGAQKLKLTLQTGGIEYIDVYIDGRPRHSRNLAAGTVEFELPENAEFALSQNLVNIELRGYAANKLVCYRRLSA